MNYLPIKGFEGFYEISDHGTIRSVDRTVLSKDNRKRFFEGKQKVPVINPITGYFHTYLYRNNVQTTITIHRLVAETFIPNPDNLPEVNHIDGVKTNNHVSNLEWVSSSGNSYHASETGLRVYTTRLTRDEFIECLHDVINGESYGSLSERVPYKVPFLSTKLRKLARELNLEHLLDDSLKEQRIWRARINGAKNTG